MTRFGHVGVLDEGGAGLRLVQTVREHATDTRVVALLPEGAGDDLARRMADEVVTLPRDRSELATVLREARLDALWPGWGPAAEDPDVAEACEVAGVRFVGPPAAVLRHVRDRVAMKHRAEELGIPVGPWSGGVIASPEEAVVCAAEVGYPVMLKAAAGAGSAGVRRVDGPADLAAAFPAASAEAEAAFGDPRLFLEHLVARARHLEIPVLVDDSGTSWAFGPHDATLRRRGAKVLLESHVPGLPQDLDAVLRNAAARLCRDTGYRGAAVVGFLVDPASGDATFLEISPRLQAEHAITEVSTGADLVALQLHLAAGGHLDHQPPAATGYAVQGRLHAGDPERGFAPTPGRVSVLRLPGGHGIRVDAAVAEGDLPPGDPPLVATITAWAPTRTEALGRLRRALAEATVVIDGGSTDRGYLLEIITRPEVRAGHVDNTLVDRLAANGSLRVDRDAATALLVAAVDAYEAERDLDQARFLVTARRGRPKVDATVGRSVELHHGGHAYRALVQRTGPHAYRVTIDGAVVDLELERLGAVERRLVVGDRVARVVLARQATEHLVEVDGSPHRFAREVGGLVRSPTPGMVVAVPVAAGDEVAAGDTVAVVESMKLEVAVPAPAAGRVREVLVTANLQVDLGQALVRLDGVAGPPVVAGAPRLALTGPAATPPGDPAARCQRDLDALRSLVLGFDVELAGATALVADLAGACAAAGPSRATRAGEHALLDTFADLRILFRGHRDEGDPDLQVRAPQEWLHAYLRSLDSEGEGLPDRFVASLRRALRHYGVTDLTRNQQLEEACYWIVQSQQRVRAQEPAVVSVLRRWLDQPGEVDPARIATLDRLVAASERRHPVVADLAREVRFRLVEQPVLDAARDAVYERMGAHLEALAAGRGTTHDLDALVACPQPLAPLVVPGLSRCAPAAALPLVGMLVRRYHRLRHLEDVEEGVRAARPLVRAFVTGEGAAQDLRVTAGPLGELGEAVAALAGAGAERPWRAELYAWSPGPAPSHDEVATQAALAVRDLPAGDRPERLVVVAAGTDGPARRMSELRHVTVDLREGEPVEDLTLRGLHPLMAERLRLWRLSEFELTRLPSADDVYLFRAGARANPKDERLVALAEVRDLTPTLDPDGNVRSVPQLERAVLDALEAMRRVQAPLPPERRLLWNRIHLHVWPVLDLPLEPLARIADLLAPAAAGLGLEEVVVSCRRTGADGVVRPRAIRLTSPTGSGFVVTEDDPPTEPLRPLDEYTRKVVQARRRGAPYPYELVKLLVAPGAGGRDDVLGGGFVEHDLDEHGELVAVDRPPGHNSASVVVGTVTTRTTTHPEGMRRVVLLGDPTKALGSLAEAECRRIMAALDLAARLRLPLEWFALSAGARIAMDTGTENMDWISAVLRRIIELTQQGQEINVVVTGINVGAQPYWNAEATMLMHTKGILVMTPDSAMVLTGKQALDYSGSVSAEDNLGIGGYERVMGPNGQGQHWAPDLDAAIGILYAHYDHAYVAPGERFPRASRTVDPVDRDVRTHPHLVAGCPFTTVGEVLSDLHNPGRKQPFDIRSVMRSISDLDHEPLERWLDLAEADTVVTWDAHVGGQPVAMIGIEGRALPRRGVLPADGPDQWTSGTLFPESSRKVARAVNAASGNRPLVVVANLAGFDGSPESMRRRQLEMGAEIGRAVVNFRGPIVFVVVSRFHGGAFVVFSQRLNDSLEIIAVEGARASVIGGAPAAAVVFSGEVDARTNADPRVQEAEAAAEASDAPERPAARARAATVRAEVRSEKLGEVAAEFDRIHSVERAQRVGSVRRIVAAADLRPTVVDAVQRGMARTLEVG